MHIASNSLIIGEGKKFALCPFPEIKTVEGDSEAATIAQELGFTRQAERFEKSTLARQELAPCRISEDELLVLRNISSFQYKGDGLASYNLVTIPKRVLEHLKTLKARYLFDTVELWHNWDAPKHPDSFDPSGVHDPSMFTHEGAFIGKFEGRHFLLARWTEGSALSSFAVQKSILSHKFVTSISRDVRERRNSSTTMRGLLAVILLAVLFLQLYSVNHQYYLTLFDKVAVAIVAFLALSGVYELFIGSQRKLSYQLAHNDVLCAIRRLDGEQQVQECAAMKECSPRSL